MVLVLLTGDDGRLSVYGADVADRWCWAAVSLWCWCCRQVVLGGCQSTVLGGCQSMMLVLLTGGAGRLSVYGAGVADRRCWAAVSLWCWCC